MYFEIGSDYGVFICGGCDKFSGRGSRGKEELDWLFEFIAHMFNVPNRDHVVPTSMEEQLRARWDEHERASLQNREL